MKKLIMSALCLMMAAGVVENGYSRDNNVITKTENTADIQKIRSILLDYYRTSAEQETEENLKSAEVICNLFQKDNKQLNQELDKLNKESRSKEKREAKKKADKDLKESLKGLKLNYTQVISLAMELESDYAKILKENHKKLEKYKDRALEIVKSMDKEDLFADNDVEGLSSGNCWDVYFDMIDVLQSDYNRFSALYRLITDLQNLISEGTLTDQFLKDHPSALDSKEENALMFGHYIPSLVPSKTGHGEIIFDAVRRTVSNQKINSKELRELVSTTFGYMQSIAHEPTSILQNITDKININSQEAATRESQFLNFYSFKRYSITLLADKNPDFKDFDREITKLSTRLAYKIYHKKNITRLLYKEWRNTYYSQMPEFFKNAVKLAQKLETQIASDKTIDKTDYEYRSAMRNISNIKEIAAIGVKKLIPEAKGNVDSQEKIKNALRNSFIQTRKAYFKNLNK